MTFVGGTCKQSLARQTSMRFAEGLATRGAWTEAEATGLHPTPFLDILMSVARAARRVCSDNGVGDLFLGFTGTLYIRRARRPVDEMCRRP